FSSRSSVGGQYNRRTQLVENTIGTGLPPGGETLAGAATLQVVETHNDQVVVGSFAEEEVGWRERLFVTAAMRADGSSTFGKNLRSTVYPKYSVSWLTSQEPFFPRSPLLSSLRLRAALG